MGKKSRTSAKDVCLNITSLESLLDKIIAEYMQTTMVPGGKIEIHPQATSEGYESIGLRSLCHFQKDCPQNFSDFMSSATTSGHAMEPHIAFPWWARSRLRYSCATISTALVRFIVPYMKKRGVDELRSLTTGQDLRMGDLEIYTLGFIPNNTHALMLRDPINFSSKTEIVESLMPSMGGPQHCSHNVLKCRESGVIIDVTLGQFLGTMKPYIFNDVDQFFSQIPGEIVSFCQTSTKAIDEQISRDNAEFRSMVSPDSKPARFTTRVFVSYQEGKEFCWSCKGKKSIGSSLNKCSTCQKAVYCGTQCQRLHWKTHKTECAQFKR